MGDTVPPTRRTHALFFGRIRDHVGAQTADEVTDSIYGNRERRNERKRKK